MEKKQLSTQEMAKILGISRQAVLKRINAGGIKAHKVGRSFVINKDDVPEILSSSLTDKKKKDIEDSVKKTVKEYGRTLELLGKE